MTLYEDNILIKKNGSISDSLDISEKSSITESKLARLKYRSTINSDRQKKYLNDIIVTEIKSNHES